MYISGVPGTGKTATCQQVVRYLQEQQDCGQLTQFNVIQVNGMRLTDPSHVNINILQVWDFLDGIISSRVLSCEIGDIAS